MPIYVLFMYPNICYVEYSHPFVVILYFGVGTLRVQTLRTRSSSFRDVYKVETRYTSVAII